MPTARHTNAIALMVSALRQEKCCFILFSHIERISIIMNASISIFKTNESFDIKNAEPCMTQPISLIAKSLVRERARTGLSLAEVARRAGIAKSTLSQLESGNGNPSLETLWALCVALDIPFAQLLEPQAQRHRFCVAEKEPKWWPNRLITRPFYWRPVRRAPVAISIYY